MTEELKQAAPRNHGPIQETDLYDFAGWLTTRPGVMTVGRSCEVGPLSEAVAEYIKTFPERFALTQRPAAQATPEPSRHPLFAASVAARKWAELQEKGHRMQSLQFDGGPGGAGSIDPWGKVMWATPEPVGEVLQFPPMPEGWPARFRCDSCDGNGEIGELVSMGHFQPPERQTCPDCGGRGWASEEHAFNADHMREFAEAHALLTRPAPGVPEGEPKLTQEELLEVAKYAWLKARTADSLQFYRTLLAAAQAKGQ